MIFFVCTLYIFNITYRNHYAPVSLILHNNRLKDCVSDLVRKRATEYQETKPITVSRTYAEKSAHKRSDRREDDRSEIETSDRGAVRRERCINIHKLRLAYPRCFKDPRSFQRTLRSSSLVALHAFTLFFFPRTRTCIRPYGSHRTHRPIKRKGHLHLCVRVRCTHRQVRA